MKKKAHKLKRLRIVVRQKKFVKRLLNLHKRMYEPRGLFRFFEEIGKESEFLSGIVNEEENTVKWKIK